MRFRIHPSEQARQLAAALTFEQLIDQLVCPNFHADQGPIPREYGSVFFHPADRELLQQQISDYVGQCRIPPLVAGDIERGAGAVVRGTTIFPSMMACSQTGSPELVYEMGRIGALEAGAAGFNWTFAPVADLAADKDSPVVSTRSAGADPDHVIRMAGAFVRGMQDHGMLATVKHFPGDGFGTLDQHLTTPENPLDMESWRSGPGRVFQALIDSGVMCVMPGHIALPAYDERDPQLGIYPPATVSRRLLTDLLSTEMGFDGIIVSDAINMGGAVNFMNYYEACAAFWEAGGDILLFPLMDGIYEELSRLVDQGRLSVETLRDRAARVLALKEQLGMLTADDAPGREAPAYDPAAHEAAARRVVEQSLTLVRDRGGLIPCEITRETRVLHVVIANDYAARRELFQLLYEELGRYSDHTHQLIDPGPDVLFREIRSGRHDLVLCSIGNSDSYGTNVVRLHGPVARNMMLGWMKLGTPVVFISHAHPFIHQEFTAGVDTLINTYGWTPHTAGLLMSGITGSIPLNRTLHVHD